MKQQLTTLCIPALRLFFRHSPLGRLNVLVWKKLCKRFINWRATEIVAETEFGARFRCSTKDLIQSCIIYFAVWEPNLTAFLRRRLGPGDVFVDVGANIGYYTLLASKLVGAEGRVIAIEASPRIHALLESNVELNRARDNVDLANVAASDRDGTVEVYAGPASNIGGTSTRRSHATELEAGVPARALDAIVGEGLGRCRLVKIDVEGAELPVLRNVLSTIDRYREDVEFVVELSPEDIEALGGSVEEIFTRFAEHGFFPYLLPNEYEPEAYMCRRPIEAPQRLDRPPRRQADIVFSRRDAAVL